MERALRLLYAEELPLVYFLFPRDNMRLLEWLCRANGKLLPPRGPMFPQLSTNSQRKIGQTNSSPWRFQGFFGSIDMKYAWAVESLSNLKKQLHMGKTGGILARSRRLTVANLIVPIHYRSINIQQDILRCFVSLAIADTASEKEQTWSHEASLRTRSCRSGSTDNCSDSRPETRTIYHHRA